jgi:hypothetical protein
VELLSQLSKPHHGIRVGSKLHSDIPLITELFLRMYQRYRTPTGRKMINSNLLFFISLPHRTMDMEFRTTINNRAKSLSSRRERVFSTRK